VRISQNSEIPGLPLGMDKKGPISGLAKKPYGFFTFDLIRLPTPRPFNLPTLFEHFC
jgi:hypothetical protein